MSIFNKHRDNTEDVYIGLRQRALELKPEDIQIQLDGANQVYGAVVDIPATKAAVTLFCSFDGTISLYFSNGGGILGSGQKYETVRKAGMEFLYSAGQTLEYMEKVTDTAYCKNDNAVVYLLSESGTFRTEFNMGEQQTEKYKAFLNFLIQRVLNALRESGAMNR